MTWDKIWDIDIYFLKDVLTDTRIQTKIRSIDDWFDSYMKVIERVSKSVSLTDGKKKKKNIFKSYVELTRLDIGVTEKDIQLASRRVEVSIPTSMIFVNKRQLLR